MSVNEDGVNSLSIRICCELVSDTSSGINLWLAVAVASRILCAISAVVDERGYERCDMMRINPFCVMGQDAHP